MTSAGCRGSRPPSLNAAPTPPRMSFVAGAARQGRPPPPCRTARFGLRAAWGRPRPGHCRVRWSGRRGARWCSRARSPAHGRPRWPSRASTGRRKVGLSSGRSTPGCSPQSGVSGRASSCDRRPGLASDHRSPRSGRWLPLRPPRPPRPRRSLLFPTRRSSRPALRWHPSI